MQGARKNPFCAAVHRQSRSEMGNKGSSSSSSAGGKPAGPAGDDSSGSSDLDSHVFSEESLDEVVWWRVQRHRAAMRAAPSGSPAVQELRGDESLEAIREALLVSGPLDIVGMEDEFPPRTEPFLEAQAFNGKGKQIALLTIVHDMLLISTTGMSKKLPKKVYKEFSSVILGLMDAPTVKSAAKGD
jgi:hypothetical protein